MVVQWGSCPSNVFFVTNGVRRGGILSPRVFLTFTLMASTTFLNNSTIGSSIGGTRVNHILYADDLQVCVFSLSSAGRRYAAMYNYCNMLSACL